MYSVDPQQAIFCFGEVIITGDNAYRYIYICMSLCDFMGDRSTTATSRTTTMNLAGASNDHHGLWIHRLPSLII